MTIKAIPGKVFRIGKRVVVAGAVGYTAFKAVTTFADRPDKKTTLSS